MSREGSNNREHNLFFPRPPPTALMVSTCPTTFIRHRCDQFNVIIIRGGRGNSYRGGLGTARRRSIVVGSDCRVCRGRRRGVRLRRARDEKDQPPPTPAPPPENETRRFVSVSSSWLVSGGGSIYCHVAHVRVRLVWTCRVLYGDAAVSIWTMQE